MASERLPGEQFKVQFLLDLVAEWHRKERGSFPSPVECVIIFWVFALIWKEIKQVYDEGLLTYMSDLWNLADCFTNMCFVGWIVLRSGRAGSSKETWQQQKPGKNVVRSQDDGLVHREEGGIRRHQSLLSKVRGDSTLPNIFFFFVYPAMVLFFPFPHI